MAPIHEQGLDGVSQPCLLSRAGRGGQRQISSPPRQSREESEGKGMPWTSRHPPQELGRMRAGEGVGYRGFSPPSSFRKRLADAKDGSFS